MSVSFNLNGESVTIEVDQDTTALGAIRGCGFTSAKNGCSPQGQCGCCTVLIDGRPVMSCTRNAERLEGTSVTTLEGFTERQRDVLAQSFVKVAGLQCGFCIPGIMMRTANFLEKNPNPTGMQVRKALKPHLCRCTGYIKILDAVEEAARHWHGETMPLVEDVTDVGASHERYQGIESCLGEKPYVDDMNVPEMLLGAIRHSDHPRARVLKIDTTAASAIPGVVSIITSRDVPGQLKVGLIERDWPVFVAEGEVTHCVGSILAAVAASSVEVARRAAAAIEIEYEVLEPVTDPKAAIEEGAAEVHEGRSNKLRVSVIKRGDIDEALAKATHVLTETFYTQRIEHAFLEPEACLAVPTGDALKIYTQGQGVHDDQRQISEVMDWAIERIQVELMSNGGAFGGKEDMSIQAHAALLAHHTGKPVKLTLSRDESILIHPKRHPIEMTYTVGADAEGNLLAVKARMIGDTGAYASVGDKVLERAAGHSCGPYRVPAVDVEATTVYTNNPPNGAFRGFGANQAAFGIEGMLDRIADLVGVDGYDIRERNILNVGERFCTGQMMTESLGIRQTLEAVKDDYKAARYVGIACGIKNTGIGNGMADIGRALIHVDDPDHVTLYTGFTEMGQGLFTILRQVLCQEAGLLPHQISVKVNTDHAVECGMTTASRATVLAGEATRRASVKMRAVLDEGATLSDLVGREFAGELICDFTSKPGKGGDNPITHMTFGYATQVVILNDAGTLEHVIAAHDVGHIMNRALCEGQIEGSLHMGLGYALTEDLPCEGGRPVSTRLNDLHIIRAKDVPTMDIRLLEVPDPIGPYGAKGVGEIGLVPTAPAVAGALHAFDGIRRVRLPMRGSAAARKILPRKMQEEDHA